MQIEELYNIFKQYPSIQTDTRKLKKGDIYFALKGENFNGNLFADQALDAGAAYAVVDEKNSDDHRLILVDDVLKTLQELAKYHRSQFTIPFIAITGSNGKTTTKELIHAVLSSSFKTYTTEGNLNNHIGVPLTILKIKDDAQLAVIEMGANHLHEIEGYCEYTLPTHGIITNTGKAHLEGFGGVEGVRKGKGELYDFLRGHNGTAFVMWDYDYLREMSKNIPKIITYGTKEADVTGNVLQSEPFLSVNINLKNGETETIHTQLVGDYNLPNVLVAITVGRHFGISDTIMKNAIENYSPSNSRSQLIEMGSNRIILDAYNANPSSMKLAIENFSRIHANKKVLLLGAMAELGTDSLAEHEAIVSLLQKNRWEAVVLVGGDFKKLKHPFLQFENSIEAKEWLREQHFEDTHFLIKGSRSMQMEKVIN